MISKKKLNKFFPSEDNSKPIINKKEAEYLSKKLNKFYKIIIQKLTKVYNKNFKIKNVEIVLRRCLVPMTYIFFERCIRSIKCQKKIKSLKSMCNFGEFYKIDDLENFFSSSVNFNYYLNQNFLYILKNKNFKIKKKINLKDDFIDFENKQSKNYLTVYYNYIDRIINFFLRKIEKFVNLFFFKKKILTLGAANSEPALVNKGFFIYNLSRLSKIEYDKQKFNKYLRNKIFSDLDTFYYDFTKVLKKYKISKKILSCLYKYYILFLEKNFPKFFLEDLDQNYYKCYNFLDKLQKKIIISSDNDDSYSTLIFLTGKNLNFKNIKIQHGGHYGYVSDNSFIDEIEFKNCDEFLTYGWKSNINNSLDFKIKFFIMPSPWLSEKVKYFENLNFEKKKNFDFIYFPQFIKPFTNNVQGLSNFRRDVLSNYINKLLEICKNSWKNNTKIAIKFYNKKSQFFLKQTIKIINFKYGNNSKLLLFNDKGISKHILSQTNLIIFDQIGTGVIECFSYGIPVMILHNSDYNKPNKLGKEYFSKLEEAGILHKTVQSLFNEYSDFKKSPKAWMNEKKRKEAIKIFCKKFAFTNKYWSIKFRNYLNTLNKV